MNSIKLNVLLLIICLPVFFMNLAFGQITQMKPIDINLGISDGSIQATVDPPFSNNTIENVFDGNQLTEAVVQNSDSLSIILYFENPILIGKSKVFFWNNGYWTLDAADTEDDLMNKTGSWQRLLAERECSFFVWDSLEFEPVQAHYIQLKAKNSQNNSVYLGEWILYNPFSLVSLKITPDPARLLSGTTLQLHVKALGNDNQLYSLPAEEAIFWNTGDPSIVTVDEFGVATGHALGSTEIYASYKSLSDTIAANVQQEFVATNADPMTIHVALVLQNQIIDPVNNRKIHEVRGWTDPMLLVGQIIQEFEEMSDGVVRFKVVETYDDQAIFTRLSSELMSLDTLTYYYSSISRLYGRNTEGTLQNLAEIQGVVKFDYNEMIDYYNFSEKRNAGDIDEIWVYAPPFAGMYESQLVGPNAFWWNSPPLDHPGLEKLLSVMGWNYERGVAEAIHSFGHRTESALVQAFGGKWDIHSENPTAWDIFTRIDKELPGKAHIGNIHFPPNGTSDYDYSNTSYVTTYADNWKRYPILLDQTRSINCQEWGCTQLGYMRWWFNHLPRFTGVTEGVLNNWWHYTLDYEAAVELAANPTAIQNAPEEISPRIMNFQLEQNYPNPFNPTTTIKFTLDEPQMVKISVHNILGQEIAVLMNERKQAGSHSLQFNAEYLSSGLYFYRLSSPKGSILKKCIVMK